MLLCLALASGPARADEAIVLIAHADLAGLDEVSVPLLRQLFLGRRTSAGGQRIHCFELAPGTKLHRTFARLVLGMSEQDLERYWLEQALSGGPLPPREAADVAELVRRVARRRGGLAYLGWNSFRGLPQAGVKILPLRHEGRLLGPEDPAYPLRLLGTQERAPAGRNEPG